MTRLSLAQAWLLASTMALVSCDLRDNAHEAQVMRDEVSSEFQAREQSVRKRFSTLEGRFEKAYKAYETLRQRTLMMDHPLNPEEKNSINIQELRSNVIFRATDADVLLTDVSLRMRHDFKSADRVPAGLLQECAYLVAYRDKPHIDADKLSEMVNLPIISVLEDSYHATFESQAALHFQFVSAPAPDLDLAMLLMNDYDRKITALETGMKEHTPAIEEGRKVMNHAFLKLWDKKILLDLGINQCQRQYTAYKGRAALNGIVPK